MFWCARVARVVSSPDVDPDEAQRQAASQFLQHAELKRIDEFSRERGTPGRAIVFFRGQLLELLRWSCLLSQDHPDDGNTFQSPDIRCQVRLLLPADTQDATARVECTFVLLVPGSVLVDSSCH